MGSTIRQMFLLLLLALLPAAGQALFLRETVPWTAAARATDELEIQAALALGDKVLWVDARTDREFEEEHIPGAVQLNEDRWNELLPQIFMNWSADKTVIVYCDSEQCNASRDVVRRLRKEAELENVFVLKDGWKAWREAQP